MRKHDAAWYGEEYDRMAENLSQNMRGLLKAGEFDAAYDRYFRPDQNEHLDGFRESVYARLKKQYPRSSEPKKSKSPPKSRPSKASTARGGRVPPSLPTSRSTTRKKAGGGFIAPARSKGRTVYARIETDSLGRVRFRDSKGRFVSPTPESRARYAGKSRS